MRRREFVTLIGSAGALPLLRLPAARAQEPGRIYRLGKLTGAARQAPRMVAFFDELKVFGFIDGQNLIVFNGFDFRDNQFCGSRCDVGQGCPGRCLLRQ
jgi:putative tryptophan/tyrosine transport system substrate-binding protein